MMAALCNADSSKLRDESAGDRHGDAARQLNKDAVGCGGRSPRSFVTSSPETTYDVADKEPAARPRTGVTAVDDSLPLPSTPLRQRRLPASFWQEPNVPRRTVRTSPWRSAKRAGSAAGRITPQTGLIHHPLPTFDLVGQADGLSAPRLPPFRYPSPAAELVLSAWRGARDGHHAFLRDWKDASPRFNFDVPAAKPPLPTASCSAVEFARQLSHLSPWSVGLPAAGYPPLTPDYAAHGCAASPVGSSGQSEELAASAAVVAAYLRWRAAAAAADDGCVKPAAVESTPMPSPPAANDWRSMMWRPCLPAAATASLAVQRLNRYHPY